MELGVELGDALVAEGRLLGPKLGLSLESGDGSALGSALGAALILSEGLELGRLLGFSDDCDGFMLG
jgi:hypothetical protein